MSAARPMSPGSFAPDATLALLGLALLLGIRLWILVAAVVALRQALDFTTLRAIGTFCSGVVLMWLLLWGLSVVELPI